MASKKDSIAKICFVIAVFITISIPSIVDYIGQRNKHTVSDFAPYPCAFEQADNIDVVLGEQRMTLQRAGDRWMISYPWWEPLNDGALTELQRFLASRMLVDEKLEVSEQERSKFSVEKPTKLSFMKGEQTLCSFELGRGYKLPDADAERRWIFPADQKNMAYRTFVHLMDFGPLFEQPFAGWRQLMLISLATSSIESIEIKSLTERYRIEQGGQKSPDNPMGWQLAEAEVENEPLKLSRFKIDPLRVSTLMELVTPFYIDDWADQISDEEKQSIEYNGEIAIVASGKKYVIQIGSEVDMTKHPEWAYLGEGARYVRMRDMDRLAIISLQRLMGVFPSITDMRNRKLWNMDLEHLIEISVLSNVKDDLGSQDYCVSYKRISMTQWQTMKCIAGVPYPSWLKYSPDSMIPFDSMRDYLKFLSKIEVIRYVTAIDKKEEDSEGDSSEKRSLDDMGLSGAVLLYFDEEALSQSVLDFRVFFMKKENDKYRQASMGYRERERQIFGRSLILSEMDISIIENGPQ